MQEALILLKKKKYLSLMEQEEMSYVRWHPHVKLPMQNNKTNFLKWLRL